MGQQQQQQVEEASTTHGSYGRLVQEASRGFSEQHLEETTAKSSISGSNGAEKSHIVVSQSPAIRSKEKTEEGEVEGLQRDQERRKAALDRYNKLRTELFPEVADISGEELLELVIENAIGDAVILVDCRSEAERQVSMYKGAVTIADFEANVENYKDKEIVAYCAIGRRSGIFLKKLLAKYPEVRVRNHAGSVVDWAHVGGPFVEEKTGNPTRRVHPNGTWAPYLPLTRNLQIVS